MLAIRLAHRHLNTTHRLSCHLSRPFASMGKKNNRPSAAAEEHLLLPSHATSSTTPIVDTHTHLASTYNTYRTKYPAAKFETVYDFVREMYAGLNVEAIVDVWCEAPVQNHLWQEFADSALTQEDRDTKWGGLEYYFVMGELIAVVVDD